MREGINEGSDEGREEGRNIKGRKGREEKEGRKEGRGEAGIATVFPVVGAAGIGKTVAIPANTSRTYEV
jgi:hypothetical protein